MMTREGFRTPQKVRKNYIAENPLWKKYYALQDKVIDKEINSQEAINIYFQTLNEMLADAKTIEETEEIIIAFENFGTNLLVLYEGFDEQYEDTQEMDLLVTIDSLIFTTGDVEQQLKDIKEDVQKYCAKEHT